MSPLSDNTLEDPEKIIASLRRERDEAVAREAALSEVLQVINSSTGDLATVFDAILGRALNLCGATLGYMLSCDGQSFHRAASRGSSPALEAALPPPGPTPGSLAERFVRGENIICSTNLAEDNAYRLGAPAARALVDVGGVRSYAAVAVRSGARLLGIIAIYRREVHPFAEEQIALLQNFAAQAVIAMENARLITETREALEQQTATAEVLQVINSSPGDLAPVFDAILEKAVSLTEAVYAHLWRFDGEHFHPWRSHGEPEFARWFEQLGPVRPNPDGDGFLGRVVRGEQVLYVADVRDTEAYRSGYAPVTGLADVGGGRGVLTVALRKDHAVLGVLTVYRREIKEFSEKQISLLQNFAAQAVIAMENARLLTETREALEQQTATAEVLQVINSSPGDLTPVFDAMLDRALDLCGAAFGVLWTYDGTHLYAEAHRGASSAYAEVLSSGPYPADATALTWRFLKGERFAHGDVAAGEGYRLGKTLSRALVDLDGGRTNLAVPLRREDALLGFIVIYRREVRPFTDKQIALLQHFAAQAVIAIENARLINETREALEQQTATAEVLQVINSSPGDLTPVFDAMLDKAVQLCAAAHGSLRIFDGEAFHLAATDVGERFAVCAQRLGPIVPYSGHPMAPLTRGEPFVQLEDARDTAAYHSDAALRQRVDDARIRSWLAVALRKNEMLLGAILLHREEVRPFSSKEIALLQNFAAQAVIAMENARLLTETREALEQQTTTAEVLQVINSSPGHLAPVFDAILEKARTVCGAALGDLMIFDGKQFHQVAVRAEPSFVEYWRQNPLRPPLEGDGPLSRLMRGERLVHLPDVREGGAYRNTPEYRRRMDLGKIRTLLAAPLLKDGGDMIGVINIYRQDMRPFSDKQIAVLQNFAAQAVIAMENARLLDELRQRTHQVAELNRGLEARVAEQVEELGRVGRLKRFLAPQLAELIVSQGDEKILESHRREIVVVFCDLRGYTAFTETAEPEEVLDFLREYHGSLGPLVSQFEGTLDQFSGDGIMVFFNDPVPCSDPAERAVKMAMAMREEAGKLIAAWRRHGCELGFGVGIAQGYATLGQIGFSDRSGYTAIGTVCNLAARLCAEAKDGQILVSSRIAEAVEAVARLENLGNLELKGLRRPVAAFNVVQRTSAPDARPNLTVVASGPEG